MIFQNCIGLDIGNDRCHIVAVRSGLRDAQVVAQTTIAYDRQLDMTGKARTVGETAGAFIQTHGLADADLFLVLPRELFIIREIRLPLSVKENLRATLGYEMQKYVPLPVSDIYFDALILSESKSDNALRLLLFIIRKQDLDPYIGLQTLLGKRFSGIEPISSAWTGALALLCKSSFAGGTLGLIRIENQAGEVSVFRNGRLSFTKQVQVSSDATTEGATADLLAAVNSTAALAPSIQWFYDEAANPPVLSDFLKEKIRPAPQPIDPVALGLPSSDGLAAYGAAMQGLRDRASRVNLLPVELRQKPSRAAYYAMLGLVLLVIMSALFWGGSVVIRHRLALSQLDAALQQLQQDALAVEEMTAKNEALQKRLEQTAQLYQGRISMLAVLQELSSRVPLSAWIQEFTFNKDGLQLSGYAESASELLTLLEDSPVFKNVVFLSAITRTKDGKEQFRIGLAIQ